MDGRIMPLDSLDRYRQGQVKPKQALQTIKNGKLGAKLQSARLRSVPVKSGDGVRILALAKRRCKGRIFGNEIGIAVRRNLPKIGTKQRRVS